jgi:hypothetical protein
MKAMDTFLRTLPCEGYFFEQNGLFYLPGMKKPADQTARQRPSFFCSHIPSDLKLQSMIFDVKLPHKGSTLSRFHLKCTPFVNKMKTKGD